MTQRRRRHGRLVSIDSQIDRIPAHHMLRLRGLYFLELNFTNTNAAHC
jgi:hypothetical protein